MGDAAQNDLDSDPCDPNKTNAATPVCVTEVKGQTLTYHETSSHKLIFR